ncbi:hypothetical protein BN1012_Phect2422 [Candidatus Phaeomarinobacter ectocarpi]|uniref:DUF2336 domain-containing protein n=1 Tax=Candidatus Phaeomarinibacter ectocarpi TaxID=1458461 RepID=X5MMR5_9HYPH|nr:DUF2336 domain-containing protein [Candidatus Phaeomarinobacter ectocarpi]CDO60635.1 hypothetical protein BN1012_Phect2422 [Candidatus Phaeomarinobacter ectocarpi]
MTMASERQDLTLRREAKEVLGLVALAQDKAGKARALIVRRLTDIALLPESQLTPQERQLVDQMLAQLVGHIEVDLRARLATRLADRADAPQEVIVTLAHDVISVARPLLEKSTALGDSDLVDVIQAKGRDHWVATSRRKELSSSVTDALIATGESEALIEIARNKGAQFSAAGYERIVHLSEKEPALCDLLVARDDITPALAHTMFWWASSSLRLDIVNRFTADRRMLREALNDAIDEGIDAFSSDPELMRTLSMMAPQRRYGPSLGEELLSAARSTDMRKVVSLLAKYADIRPQTAAHIVTDPGGEALAVAAKALGMTRKEFLQFALLIASHRDSTSRTAAEVNRLTALFDSVATDRADVVLRYWDDTVRATKPSIKAAGRMAAA